MDGLTGRTHETTGGRRARAGTLKRKRMESGQTLTEFALMLPVLCLLMIGIVEIGRATAITIGVNNAATAGAEYGAYNEAAAQDVAKITEAATDDFNIAGMTVNTVHGCSCDYRTGSSCTYPVMTGSCDAIDCGEDQIIECVQVETHAQWDSLFHYPGLPTTYQANGRAVLRVRR